MNIKPYFSNIEQIIINTLETANTEILIAVAWFTNKNIFEILLKKLPNINVKLIILADDINFNENGLNFQFFIDNGGELYLGVKDKVMHNKFCIIDQATVITGSYNYTYNAELNNDENIIISNNNIELANSFLSEYNRLIQINCSTTNLVDYFNNNPISKDIFSTSNIKKLENEIKLTSDIYGSTNYRKNAVAVKVYTDFDRLGGDALKVQFAQNVFNSVTLKYETRTIFRDFPKSSIIYFGMTMDFENSRKNKDSSYWTCEISSADLYEKPQFITRHESSEINATEGAGWQRVIVNGNPQFFNGQPVFFKDELTDHQDDILLNSVEIYKDLAVHNCIQDLISHFAIAKIITQRGLLKDQQDNLYLPLKHKKTGFTFDLFLTRNAKIEHSKSMDVKDLRIVWDNIKKRYFLDLINQ